MALPLLIEREILMEDELMGLVSQLATWIGDVAPEVWAIMLKQAMVQGWQYLFGAIIGLAIIVAFIVVTIKTWEDSLEEGFIVLWCFGVIGGMATFISCTLSAIGHLVNPAYYALLNIRNIFR